MDDLLQDLIAYAIEKKASDIHFVMQNQKLQIKLRTQNDMLDVYQDIWQPAFFEYLKFISRMDLTSPYVPQSGQFKILLHNHEIFCRFSMLNNHNVQTGVIRMLNTMHAIELKALSLWKEDTNFFNSLVPLRQGLVISVGPTNSGKTTTLHALLHEIAKTKKHKVVSLEDPIEIEDDSYLQLQINESMGFTYDVGIEQFAMLMNQGLPLDTLIRLTFKKDEEIITYLKEGMNLQEIFTLNQKKLYFKYLRILSEKLNLRDALDCVNKIEKSSNTFFETLLKKISYPFFLLIFAFFMILFFSDYVLVQMKDYISNGMVFVFIHLLKWGFGFAILSMIFYLFLYYVLFYKYNSKMKCPFRLMKKMISLQFVCMYQALDKSYTSTQEILETLACMDFSVVGKVSNEILACLKNGKSLEESFLEIDVFDSDFKKMLVYALTSNQMHVFFDLYMKKCSLDLDKSVKKISTGIQLFSYISIGILVLIVYQIMMMPLNMLNQF